MFQKQTYKDKPFRLTNSLEGKRVEFRPLAAPKVLFYSCGPTVYGPLHIGNARALATADLFYRWLKHVGYDVNYVRNFTDVDDKIINRAKQEGKDSAVVAQFYLDYAREDMAALGLAAPTKEVRVTESMGDIIDLVKSLVERENAYTVKGEVLFSIETFKEYGKLSGKKVDDLVAGARVEVGTYKKNPLDFSLWKPQKPGEPFWESPWGQGRPGWHIECSAMAKKWLGDTIDLHHGGQDLVFPHHENEIAQSECGNGKPFCAHWVHNAFITVGREKMSKSLGNIFEIRAFVEKYGAEVLRYEFVRHHYRSPFDFTAQSLGENLTELERVYATKKWANDALAAPVVSGADGSAWSAVPAAQSVYTAAENELFGDLSTPGALSQLFIYVRAINSAEGKAAGQAGRTAASTPERQSVARQFIDLLNESYKPLMNVFGEDAQQMLTRIESIRKEMQKAVAGDGALTEEAIMNFIDERNAARKNKDFARADTIRKELDAKGVLILDTPQGTSYKWK